MTMKLTDKEIEALAEIAENASSLNADKFEFSFTRRSQHGEPSVTISGSLEYMEDDSDVDDIKRIPYFRLTSSTIERAQFDPRSKEKPLIDQIRL